MLAERYRLGMLHVSISREYDARILFRLVREYSEQVAQERPDAVSLLYALAFGIDRLAMIRYQIKDIRTLFASEKSFLQQFSAI